MKVVSALVLVLLAGCGNDTSSQTATNARNPAGAGPAAVALGSAGNPGAAGSYVVLAKTGISSVPGSAVTGDMGLSPAAATFLTGFSLIADATNVFSTSTQVSGKVFAANYAVPSPINLTTAIGSMEGAYSDAASRTTPDFVELGTGNIGGQTLVPGLYKWTSAVTIPANLTIAGGANDVWIFQTSGDLTMAAAKTVTLSGGARAKNIFWQVAGQATLGANSHFEGVILSKTTITLQTGATMNGRALAQTQVALQQATITQPAP
jgi:Ice-binding-like